MRYIPLSNSVYNRNRRNFMDEMKGNSLAVFNSNDIYPVSADSNYLLNNIEIFFISLVLIKKKPFYYYILHQKIIKQEKYFLSENLIIILRFGKVRNLVKNKQMNYLVLITYVI